MNGWVTTNFHQLGQCVGRGNRKIEKIRFSMVAPGRTHALIDFGGGLKNIMRGHPLVFDFSEVNLDLVWRHADLLSIQVMFADPEPKPIIVQRDTSEKKETPQQDRTQAQAPAQAQEIRVPERYRKKRK